MERRNFLKLLGGLTAISYAPGLLAATQSDSKNKTQKPKNIILFMADGMGVAQWQATSIVTKRPLQVLQMTHTGMITTTPLDTVNGDAPSHCTAMATGTNVNKGLVGMDSQGNLLKNILEYAREKGLKRGVVSANSLVEGSIVPFVAHAKNRMQLEAITAAYVDQEIDVMIGSGKDFFLHHVNGFGPGPGGPKKPQATVQQTHTEVCEETGAPITVTTQQPKAGGPSAPMKMTLTDREDGRNLIQELQKKGYTLTENLQDPAKDKLVVWLGNQDLPNLEKNRDENQFPQSVERAIQQLSKSNQGFFLVVGDMFVDRASHDGNLDLLVKEAVNLDKAISKAVEFAKNQSDTLVVVVGTPEASGMSIVHGNATEGKIEANWAIPGMVHTGIMVPYFAMGAGAESFEGYLQNTDMFHLLKL